MAYDVLDISRYVINYCNEKKQEITNLRLQKILYFIQASFLREKGLSEPCFRENIEAWSFGPVVREVYFEFRPYGNSPIPCIDEYLVFDRNKILNSVFKKYSDPFECDEDRKITDEMIDECNMLSVSRLVEITHKQKPWKDVYVPNMNNVISIESIYDYFKER